ncbi:hypothetical protein DES38_103125 [Streptohalobacillus salinus]|uniref:Permuted papain-like amidase YaeF/Yiix C92 family enzyme n=1 Tax=Streptohalobacillus salinus TaxID=621096 RepID=A0A2V3WC19_9BACI|nr:hypothetical protein [Streptohalobacillus salinus]PXW92109.1 hypothetical protein DES38_103125 [Streptohalobacillus salinus]
MNKSRPIYLLFLSTGTLLSKTIDLYTGTSLNHVSIALDPELSQVYSFGRKRPYNPFIGGFVKESVTLPFFTRSNCAIYQLDISEDEYQQLVAQILLIESTKHLYRYNFLGLFGVAINKELKREHAYFCSQFVATMLQRCGVYNQAKSPGLIRPQDLRDWHLLDLVYEGPLKDYPALVSTEETSETLRQSFFRLN